MSHYTHLTIEEREKARVLKEQGKSYRAIGRELKREHTTIMREIKRNTGASGEYKAYKAQQRYEKSKKNCGMKAKLRDEGIKEYVIEKLESRWSPEQISGRAKLEKQEFTISYNTIYRAIESGVLPKSLKKQMRFKRKYNKKQRSGDKRGKILDTVNISKRPAGANNRTRYGHWESDTVMGKRRTGCIATHVERKAGFLVAFYLPNLRDNAFIKTTAKVFQTIPDNLKKSFTVDNGTEFADHIKLARDTGMNVYFCDPYSSWQRGTNENTNGLLRQFFPKGSSFTGIDNGILQHAVFLINNRPRKRLGFKSPAEVLGSFIWCS